METVQQCAKRWNGACNFIKKESPTKTSFIAHLANFTYHSGDFIDFYVIFAFFIIPFERRVVRRI